MRFAVPLFWLLVAGAVYVYNSGDDGKIVLFGLEYLVGDDLVLRGHATVGVALFFAAITGARPIASLLQGAPTDPED